MKVIIYALVDPITCEIRYIGRTSISLNARLSSHIHRSKYSKEKTYKVDWIKSLLKINCKPLIRKLTEIEGWEESYKFEVNLIEKYKDRLTNYYDRGPGKLRSCREEDKLKISETLKRKYKEGLIKMPKGRVVYVYSRDGSFYKEFKSIAETAKELGISYRTIYKHVHKIKPLFKTKMKSNRKRFLRGSYQYSFKKVKRMHNYNIKE